MPRPGGSSVQELLGWNEIKALKLDQVGNRTSGLSLDLGPIPYKIALLERPLRAFIHKVKK
jgi:hypothetical protein